LFSEAAQEVPGGDLVNHGAQAVTDLLFIDLNSNVVLAMCEIFPAIHRAMIGDLNDPRGCRTFLRVEELRLLKQLNEDFLAEVLGFCSVTQYAACHAQYWLAISAEELPQGISRSASDLGDQGFIREG